MAGIHRTARAGVKDQLVGFMIVFNYFNSQSVRGENSL